MTPNMFKVNDENTRTMSFSLIRTEYGEKFKHIWRRSGIFIARHIFLFEHISHLALIVNFECAIASWDL